MKISINTSVKKIDNDLGKKSKINTDVLTFTLKSPHPFILIER